VRNVSYPSIFFSSQKARTFLISNGEVYTLRRSRRPTGYAHAFYVNENGRSIEIGLVYVEEIGVVLKAGDLLPYVRKSGFESVEEWLSEARKSQCKLPAWLYKVELVKGVKDSFCGKRLYNLKDTEKA